MQKTSVVAAKMNMQIHLGAESENSKETKMKEMDNLVRLRQSHNTVICKLYT